jgi:ParB family chromosome partitioning protein
MAGKASKRNERDFNVGSALDELFPTRGGPQVDADAVWIERSLIDPDPRQPRKAFAPDKLRELGLSLRSDGQLQACLVRPHPDAPGRFQIISGERRWRAAAPEFADLPRLRCLVREVSDAEAFRLALAENIHREDLSIVERARALVQIKQSAPGFTWDAVAEQAQLSKRRILQLVDLLKLPAPALAHLESGAINEKHARALLALHGDPQEQRQLLKDVLRGDLSGNAALARAEGRAVRVGAANTAGTATPRGKRTPPDQEGPLPGSRAGLEVEVEIQALFNPILAALDHAVGQASAVGSAPGFTSPLAAQAASPDPLLRDLVRAQLEQIKQRIESLEKALAPNS